MYFVCNKQIFNKVKQLDKKEYMASYKLYGFGIKDFSGSPKYIEITIIKGLLLGVER